ncbi:hypothetical protein [Deinococcus marmoris]|uniref:hypothetical protein n=1 Tax=Deinococcus marmoris TaxID=249408 RepID=UPI000497A14A|nr:hypothetical protein [Deinococcus marmoris]
MTTPQFHTYTVPFFPNPLQEQALAQLSAQARVVRQACVDQATLAQSGQVTSLPALLGGPKHAECSAAAELRALMALPALATFPIGLLHHAVKDQRARIARAGEPVAVEEPVTLAGDGLISPVGAQTLQLAGVPGEVTVGTDHLPRWAASAWARAVGVPDPAPELELGGARLTDWTFVERGPYNGVDGWLIDVELRWDAWPVGSLLRGLDEEQWPPSEAVQRLMDPAR